MTLNNVVCKDRCPNCNECRAAKVEVEVNECSSSGLNLKTGAKCNNYPQLSSQLQQPSNSAKQQQQRQQVQFISMIDNLERHAIRLKNMLLANQQISQDSAESNHDHDEFTKRSNSSTKRFDQDERQLTSSDVSQVPETKQKRSDEQKQHSSPTRNMQKRLDGTGPGQSKHSPETRKAIGHPSKNIKRKDQRLKSNDRKETPPKRRNDGRRSRSRERMRKRHGEKSSKRSRRRSRGRNSEKSREKNRRRSRERRHRNMKKRGEKGSRSFENRNIHRRRFRSRHGSLVTNKKRAKNQGKGHSEKNKGKNFKSSYSERQKRKENRNNSHQSNQNPNPQKNQKQNGPPPLQMNSPSSLPLSQQPSKESLTPQSNASQPNPQQIQQEKNTGRLLLQSLDNSQNNSPRHIQNQKGLSLPYSINSKDNLSTLSAPLNSKNDNLLLQSIPAGNSIQTLQPNPSTNYRNQSKNTQNSFISRSDNIKNWPQQNNIINSVFMEKLLSNPQISKLLPLKLKIESIPEALNSFVHALNLYYEWKTTHHQCSTCANTEISLKTVLSKKSHLLKHQPRRIEGKTTTMQSSVKYREMK